MRQDRAGKKIEIGLADAELGAVTGGALSEQELDGAAGGITFEYGSLGVQYQSQGSTGAGSAPPSNEQTYQQTLELLYRAMGA